MSEKETVQGLSCPNCGGMVPIPEGQSVVRCPFCDQRSFVRGERGQRRYQVPARIQRDNALEVLRRFFGSSLAIARDAARQATLSETFLVYLPFWTIWARMAGWAFGEKKVGSGNNRRYEPREVRLVQEVTWSGAACDVGEFGVNELLLIDQELQPFNPDELHLSGMVFEPASSFSAAEQAAEAEFQAKINSRAGLDRLSQLFMRTFRQRRGLVYYPLWVLRYLYRGRAFQVVVDGYSGKVLYGKAPGNTIYRAAVLVLSMATGAFLAIDVSALILYFLADSNDSPFWLVLLTFAGGLGLMYSGYRRYRYGEQYEKREGGKKSKQILPGVDNPLEMISSVTNVKDVEEWIKRLS
jgi:DNA-directed RNA polymerase subunit RPC12/RpoP